MTDRRRPPETAADPLSYSEADSYTDTEAAHKAASPTREGEMAIAARNLGVAVRSTDPVLHGWVRDGFTVEQLRDAIGLARIRKPQGAIPANYLDPILREPIKPPQGDALSRLKWRPPPDEVA